jgi:NAD(P)-dependent dehydrogenase (short-subunit alcohol dehydrogenase family)
MTGILSSRQIVVTGGTGALGGAVIARLLEEGATCHVPSRGAPDDFRFAGDERVRLTPGVDISDAASVDAFYAALPGLYASIHVAGGFAMGRIDEVDGDALAKMLAANTTSAFLCCRAAIRGMLAAGTPGHIVNVTARPGLEPRKGAGMVAYTASKAAVAAMTVALAEEVKGAGITVNAIAPATLDTPANRAAMPKADPGKWVGLHEAAEAVLSLVSPANGAISGALVPLYGRA